MKKYNYVYKITCKETGMFYIGSRSSMIEPILDIGVVYFTSSKNKTFRKDFKSNPECFFIDIVWVYNNYIDMLNLEIHLHEFYEVSRNINSYNIAKQTSTGFSNLGVTYSKEHCQNLSKLRKGTNSGSKNPMFGRCGDKHPNYGKKLSEEEKNKLRVPKSESSKNSYKLSMQNRILLNQFTPPMLGKFHTDETKKKMRESHNDVSGKNNPMYGVKLTGEKNHMFGKKRINNGIINKQVPLEDLNHYLDNGWILGMKKLIK